MDWLKKDLERYTRTGLVLLAGFALAAAVLLERAVAEFSHNENQDLFIMALLVLMIAATSAKHPLSFLSNGTAVSVPETLIFLGVIVLGPYQGALVGAVDMLLVGRRLKLRPTVYVLNISHMMISVYVAGKIYYAVASFITSRHLATGMGQRLLVTAVPLLAMALAFYVLQIAITAMMSHLIQAFKIWDRIRDTFPWEPISFLACATVAGLINYCFIHHGPVTTVLIMVLVMPVPIIVYYTFKTYHDKLGEQENHYQELTSIYDSILEMLAMAIDAKDDVTHDHIQRVKLFARRVGEMVGLSDMEIEALKAGALLHDIGKIGVPAYILNKPGKLTEHEFEQMKMHTIIGADMLSNVDFRYPVVPIVRHHHERWDGRGYPYGLKGEEIPITARILTLVDNYDALRSDRPYKKGMTREEALAYIKQNAGTFFDPKLVDIFLAIVDNLEIEAATCKSSPKNKQNQTSTSAMAKARPAAGFANAPEVDRATAALNSIAETNQRVTALYDMARTLASNLSVEDTVAILANRLTKLIPFTTCAISLFDPSRSEFEIVHAIGGNAEKFLRRRQPAEAGITGYVITNQRPMYNTNPLLDLGFLGSDLASKYKAVVVFPLVRNQEPLGAIALYSSEIESYGSEHIQLMESVSQPASDAVYNALSFEQAQRAAFTDPSTGLANLRAFSAQFDRERARCQRQEMPLSILYLSVDNLAEAARKASISSDQVMFSMSRLMRQQMRETDFVARQSANTFIAMLPEIGTSEVGDVCRRMREAFMRTDHGCNISISIGTAVSPADGNSLEELIQAAQLVGLTSHESVPSLASLDFGTKLHVGSIDPTFSEKPGYTPIP